MSENFLEYVEGANGINCGIRAFFLLYIGGPGAEKFFKKKLTNNSNDVIIYPERKKEGEIKMSNYLKESSTKPFMITIIICVILLIFFCVYFTILNNNYYSLSAEIINIDSNNNTVICLDTNGNLWEFFGCGNYQINDSVKLIMDKNSTELIYDDIILMIKK